MRNNILLPRDPFREFDALVRSAFGPTAVTGGLTQTTWTPAAETDRDGDDAVIRVELPGVDVTKDVSVELKDGRLVISGERRDERDEESDGRRLREIRYGSFSRSFRLGAHVTADAVTASYDAGVLTVRVKDVYAAARGERIAIATGGPAEVEVGSSDDES